MDRKNIFKDSGISLNQLRSKQSVRTTFKLPQEVISLLSIISGQLGIKQKSLLDQLTEDINTLRHIALNEGEVPKRKPTYQQKTFVMSKSSLQAINDVAQQRGIPRDILLELSIRRLMPVISEERGKHRKRKIVLQEMYAHLESLEDMANQSVKLLGSDDNLSLMLENQVRLAQKNIVLSEGIIEKGQALEDW
ncbi:MAG: hypothetical protein OCC45_06160 [Desulfotalea sp.]